MVEGSKEFTKDSFAGLARRETDRIAR